MNAAAKTVITLCVLGAAAVACPASPAKAGNADLLKKVGFDQRLNEQVPLDLEFTDDAGKAVRLRDYFGEKPVILVLAYYKCPMLCTLVLNGLTQALRETPFTIGKEFNVVTVSFNPRETPNLAAAKKKTYLKSYGRPGAADGWHFLTGKEEAIEKLTKAVGFRYLYDAKQDQYIHTSGIVILTPKGKISRYFYGISYPARRAAGVGRGVERQDRLGHRRGVAVLFSLRSGNRQIHDEHFEFRPRRRCLHGCHGARHGVGVISLGRAQADETGRGRGHCRFRGKRFFRGNGQQSRR